MTLAAVSLVGACGDDEDSDSSSTTAPVSTAVTTTSSAPVTSLPSGVTTEVPTTSMGSDLESLGYLLQGLLTTDEIGGGWVDQGRQIVPPGSDQMTGFLCPDGEAAVEAIGGRLDAQVSTRYRRADDVGLSLFASSMWGERDRVVEDFESFVAAVEGCDGETYDTEDLGELTLTLEEAPELGVSAIAFRFGPVSPPTDDPWLEQQMTMVLLSDPEEPVALVLTVGAVTVHDPPDADTTEIDPAEYTRIVDAAVAQIVDGS